MILAPLGLSDAADTADVRRVCAVIIDRVDTWRQVADEREARGQPRNLSDIEALNQARVSQLVEVQQALASHEQRHARLMERLIAECPELNTQPAALDAVLGAVLMPYRAQEWCKAQQKKPQSAWSMEESFAFAQNCI